MTSSPIACFHYITRFSKADVAMENKKKILIQFFGEHITPYWNAFYREVDRHPEFELLVHNRIGIPGSHPWEFKDGMNYRYRNFVRPLFIPDVPSILSVLKERNSLLFFIGAKGITKILLLITAVLLNIRFVYFTDTLPDDHFKGVKGFFRRRFIFYMVFRYAEKVLSTGTAGVEQLITFGCPESKAVNFPYFIEIPSLKDVEKSQKKNGMFLDTYGAQDDVVLLASGRFIRRKGFDIIIDALHMYLKSSDNKQVKLFIAGDGPLSGELRKQVAELNLEKHVFFPGWVQPDQLDDFFGMGDVFIHMARYEPYGVVVLEAMARKLPVIGSDMTMAVRDRIRHGENGFIIKTGDVNGLAGAIGYFAEQNGEMRKMGDAARKAVEEWPIEKGIKVIEEVGKNMKAYNG